MRVAKNELRQRMKELREALSPDDVVQKSAAAAAHVLALPELAAARVVAVYAPISGSNELATRPIHDGVRARGGRVVYPIVRKGELPLEWSAVDDVDDVSALPRSSLGIPTPPPSAPRVPLDEIDLFVIPGLAFDLLGERLGWGGGHYDRTVSRVPRATRVGYAYDFQLVPLVPVGADDQRVDVVVTERGSRPAQKGRTR